MKTPPQIYVAHLAAYNNSVYMALGLMLISQFT